jgi:predicted molibdopterin-dependent oxidoreductase YjgC
MYAFAKMVGEAQKAVFVWSMGITQHECGEDNVRSIINLALTKGFVGREGCGLMPIEDILACKVALRWDATPQFSLVGSLSLQRMRQS